MGHCADASPKEQPSSKQSITVIPSVAAICTKQLSMHNRDPFCCTNLYTGLRRQPNRQ